MTLFLPIWKVFDADGSGTVNWEEFISKIRNLTERKEPKKRRKKISFNEAPPKEVTHYTDRIRTVYGTVSDPSESGDPSWLDLDGS